ncbi:MAG: isoprenylcysteine carboxylmethyltransferase family protein [Verrucomicrobia bacterium]|nr:isoprenylcysteine carboxylmethyltransferase family protein [Verrucomicrobiota bacterium]
MQETEPASKTDHSSKNLALTLGRKFFANRLLFGLIIAFLAAFFIRIHRPWSDWPMWRVLSAVLVLLGLGIRALADGFAGRHTRTEEIEAPRLSTGGPYSFVRNPIYVGSMVLGLGMVGLLASWIALIPYLAVFAVFYFAVIPAEEQFLRKTFGRQYEEYCQNVPRMRPRLTPWSGAEKTAFDWKPALGEWRVALAIMAILVFFTLTSLVWH